MGSEVILKLMKLINSFKKAISEYISFSTIFLILPTTNKKLFPIYFDTNNKLTKKDCYFYWETSIT